MFEILFLDLDDTILDFQKQEYIALGKTLADYGVEPTDEIRSLYSRINKGCWHKLELGEMTRDQVKVRRFGLLFEELGITVDESSCALDYEKNLAIGHYFLPGAEEAVERLSKKYRLFLTSNGTASVQAGRMTSANLYRFFEKVFVSQEIGHNKPTKAYFDACIAQIPNFDREKTLMVGDSLTSDILGGINAGIATCWVNPKGAPRNPEIPADYEIKALSELEHLLEAL